MALYLSKSQELPEIPVSQYSKKSSQLFLTLYYPYYRDFKRKYIYSQKNLTETKISITGGKSYLSLHCW